MGTVIALTLTFKITILPNLLRCRFVSMMLLPAHTKQPELSSASVVTDYLQLSVLSAEMEWLDNLEITEMDSSVIYSLSNLCRLIIKTLHDQNDHRRAPLLSGQPRYALRNSLRCHLGWRAACRWKYRPLMLATDSDVFRSSSLKRYTMRIDWQSRSQ